MSALERRDQIINILCEKKFVRVEYLANEFNVSERTIRNDILELSLSYPIFTKSGKYDGGVYIAKGYRRDKDYLSQEQEDALMLAMAVVDEKTRKALESIKKKFAMPRAN